MTEAILQPRPSPTAKARPGPSPSCPPRPKPPTPQTFTPVDEDGWVVPPPVRLADGSRMQLYKDGQALHAAYEAIRHARRRIGLEVYIFHGDDTGRAFADLLCEKARQGVKVFVIYDGFGSVDTDRTLFRKMKSAGVKLQEFHPFRPWECKFSWRPANRDHRKLLVIDDDIAGLGGLNVGAEYAGSWVIPTPSKKKLVEHWRDNAVGIIGPSTRPLFQSFRQTWQYCQRGGRIRRAELVHNLFPADGQLGLLASVPTISSPLRPFLCKLLRSARKSIDLTMAYFAPDDELIHELCAASQRGARVRLMLPGRCDVKLLRTAAQSFYETMLGCGIEVYERQCVVLHAKTMVVDGEAVVIGSTNLDYRSIEYNCELSAVVRSATFGAQMTLLFENDVTHAEQIPLERWRHRPTWDRAVQWAISRARYLL